MDGRVVRRRARRAERQAAGRDVAAHRCQLAQSQLPARGRRTSNRGVYGGPQSGSDTAHAVRAAYDRAQAEKNGSIVAEAQLPGPQWAPRGAQMALQGDLPGSDAAAAADRNRQQLQSAICDRARKLASLLSARAHRYSNMATWSDLAPAAEAFSIFAALPPETVIDHLGEAYANALLLGRLWDTDEQAQRGRELPDPPLDLDVRAALTDLVRLAAPWLRGFPMIRGWDDDAGQVLAKPTPRATVELVIQRARDAEAISDADAATISTLGKAGDWPKPDGSPPVATPPGEKATRLAVVGATNLMLSLGEIEAAELAATVERQDVEQQKLALRARAVLRANILTMEGFDLPDDVRAALKVLADPAHAPKRETPPPPQAIPKDVEQQAREMILRGEAPPAHWRPHIRHLKFPFDLADAAPLAGLTALTWLNLYGRRVADAAPLAGLTALTTLFLGGTKITDAAPLAGLTALTRLYLGGTKIVDLAPLAGLTALKYLDLSDTRAADLSPLASLRNLKKLVLRATPTLDLAPLAGLIAGGSEIEGKRVPKSLARKPRASPRRPAPPAP